MTKSLTALEIVISTQCPLCNAKKGKPCIASGLSHISGKPHTRAPHSKRIKAYENLQVSNNNPQNFTLIEWLDTK